MFKKVCPTKQGIELIRLEYEIITKNTSLGSNYTRTRLKGKIFKTKRFMNTAEATQLRH